MAERAERGLLVRSVAPVAEWLRWDGGGGHWGSWRLGSPQRERGSRALERRGSEGQDYRHRMLPPGWCQAPGRQIATLLPGQGVEDGEAGEGVVRGFFSQLSFRLGEAGREVEEDEEGEGAVGSACFGQVSRRLGRLLRRLPKSRSWSDGLRMLRRTSSSGSLLASSGTEGWRGEE